MDRCSTSQCHPERSGTAGAAQSRDLWTDEYKDSSTSVRWRGFPLGMTNYFLRRQKK